MKKILIVLMVLFLAANCFALELVRQKNVATVIMFPLIDSTTTTALQSSATALDSEIDQWSDSADNPDGFADCANEATEVGTTGQYYLILTQGEMNENYIIVQIKASDALTQVILIRTTIGDPLLLATTTAGGLAATAAEQAKVPKSDGAVSWNATALGAMEAEAYDALELGNLDHLVKVAVDTNLQTTVHDNSVIGYWLAKANVTNYNRTEDSGEGRTDYGDVNWLTAVNVNVLSENNIDFGALKKTSLDTALATYDGPTNAEMEARTVSATAAGNLEDTYDGTGYNNDVAPATQVQVATLAGGIALRTAATGINIDEPNGGEQTLTYAATTTHDGSYHEVASDDAGNDIDFYYTFNTGDGDNLPVDFHFVGYYEDNNAPANSTMVIQVYDFTAVGWVTIATLTDSSGDVNLDLPLNVHDVDPSGGTEGEVRIRFNLTTPEVTQNVRIDYATIGFVSGAGGLTAAAVVDEWETQSQADPTGFHVNLLEVEDADATTYIEGRTLASADYFLYGSDDVAVVTLLNGLAANIITAASIAPNAIDASAIAPNAIDASAIAPNAIDADSIAPNAIDAATFAADVDAEIAAYILNAATNAYGGAGTYGQAIEDTLADTNELQIDWTNGGRLDLIIDIIQAYWDSLTITGGYLETDIVNLDGTAVKSTSGNIHALPGNI